MKLLFIAGLEHSGSTLTAYLISQLPGYVALGEIYQTLSVPHMRTYLQRWQGRTDHDACSCGQRWVDCEFWGCLTGSQCEAPEKDMVQRYRLALERARATYGDDITVVDSSKISSALELLVLNRAALGLEEGDIRVLWVCKDVRSYVTSACAKFNSSGSLWRKARQFNLWVGAYRALKHLLDQHALGRYSLLYEALCRSPASVIAGALDALGLPSAGTVVSRPGVHHFAIGNKNFLIRNRDRVVYDTRWYLDDAIHVLYLLHLPARRLNRRLYEESNGPSPNPVTP